MAKTAEPIRALIDTGIIYALADKNDRWHPKAVSFVRSYKGRLIVPSTVVPEACYLLNRYLGAAIEQRFVQDLINGDLYLEHFIVDDLARTVVLLDQYRDQNIGFVDANLVAIAERLKVSHVLTTDRRHFSIIRPIHCEHFTLLP